MTRLASLAAIALLLGMAPGVAADPFAGRWVSADPKAGGLARLEITKADKGWAVRAWEGGADRGTAALHLLADAAGGGGVRYGIASWDGKSRATHLTLRLEGGALAAEEFAVSTDGPGRPNRRTASTLRKERPAAAVDDATRKRAEQKAARVVEALRLADEGKAARVRAVAADWLAVMAAWHGEHDAELGRLWGEWNTARAAVPKDEFPGEVVAHRIDAAYASLRPAYEAFVRRLSAELTADQVDAVKENWSRSPGMTRTYNAYLEAVPGLADKDKEVIRARLLLAREAAMLTDADREIAAVYKRHKVKVEQYVGALEWAKLHRAFAERGRPPADPKE